MSSHNQNVFVGVLEHNPDVAVWLGAFMADFAALEFWIVKLGALALGEGEDMPISHAICGRIRNITDRAEIIRDCLQKSALSNSQKTLASGFIDELLAINARRNEYAHGLYETNLDDGAVRLTTWGTTSGRKGKIYDPLTAEQIKMDTLAIRRLSGRIGNSLFPSELKAPPGAGTSLGTPPQGNVPGSVDRHPGA